MPVPTYWSVKYSEILVSLEDSRTSRRDVTCNLAFLGIMQFLMAGDWVRTAVLLRQRQRDMQPDVSHGVGDPTADARLPRGARVGVAAGRRLLPGLDVPR